MKEVRVDRILEGAVGVQEYKNLHRMRENETFKIVFFATVY